MGGFTHGGIMVQKISTGTFCPSKWVVDPVAGQGTHTTVTTAMASASSGDTISIRPGTYAEAFTWKSGVSLTAWGSDAFNPNVTLTGPITISAVGFNCSISGINLSTNGSSVITASSTGNLYITNCNMTISNNSVISATGGAQVYVSNCQGDTVAAGTGNIFSISSGQIFISNSRIFNITGSASANTLPTGTAKFFLSNSYLAGWDFTIAAGNSFNVINSFVSAITITGTATNNNIFNSTVGALSIGTNCSMTICNSVISSSVTEPVISGAGTLIAAGLTFTGSRGVSAATLQVPAYTYGNVLYTNTVDRTQPEIGLRAGTGVGAGSATQGTLYLTNSGSSSSTRAYINTNGTTGWTNITTAT